MFWTPIGLCMALTTTHTRKKSGGGKRAAGKKARGKVAPPKKKVAPPKKSASHLKGWDTRRKNERAARKEEKRRLAVAATRRLERERKKRALLRAARKEEKRRLEAAKIRRLKREQKKREKERERKKVGGDYRRITPAQQWQRDNQAIERQRDFYRDQLLKRFNPFYADHIGIQKTTYFVPWIRHLFLFDPYKKRRQFKKVLCSRFDPRFCYLYYDVAAQEFGQIFEQLKWHQANSRVVRFLIALDYEYFGPKDEDDDDYEETQARKIYEHYPARRTPYGFISTNRYDLTGRSTRDLINLIKYWDILSIVVTP